MRAAHGRTFAPGEDQLGNDKVVVLTNALWQNRFGCATNRTGSIVDELRQPEHLNPALGRRTGPDPDFMPDATPILCRPPAE